jgi:hypothetical protein
LLILLRQLDFLDRARLDSDFVQDKLPLVERDYGRAVELLEEDAAALSNFEISKDELCAAMREREVVNLFTMAGRSFKMLVNIRCITL